MKRVLSALVGIPLVVLLVLGAGEAVFARAAAALALLALGEYLVLCATGWWMALAALGAGLYTFAAVVKGGGTAAVAPALVALALAALWRADDTAGRFRSLGEAAFGLVYCAFFLSALLLLRGAAGGGRLVMLVLVVLWSGDTLAFWGGSRFGKRRFAPRLSPGKTWAGAACGLAGSLAGGIACGLLLPPGLSLRELAIFSLAVGAAGQAGDLLESFWKRAKGAKDSGRLIPGHGGILDRIDSLMLGAPVGWYLVRRWGG